MAELDLKEQYCECCNAYILFDQEHDAYFCPQCKDWVLAFLDERGDSVYDQEIDPPDIH